MQQKTGKGETKEQKSQRTKNKFLSDKPNHINNYIKYQGTETF